MKRKRKDRAKKDSNIVTQSCKCGKNMIVRRNRKAMALCWVCRGWISKKREMK